METEIVAAYRATFYVAYGTHQETIIRIGSRSLETDRLLAKMRVRSGAFITGWNPYSSPLNERRNEQWDRLLKRYLCMHSIRYIEGEGRDSAGDWPPERSVLAFGVSYVAASSIGRRFRQNAIVYVASGQPAELVMLRWMG